MESKYTINQGKYNIKIIFCTLGLDRGLKTLRFKAFQLIKKNRAFLPESIFGHFRSYALKIDIIRDFGHH